MEHPTELPRHLLTGASSELACGLAAMGLALAVCLHPAVRRHSRARHSGNGRRPLHNAAGDAVLDRASFATLPGARRTEAQWALRRTFLTEFASTVRRMSMRGLISPRALRGVSRIRIVNAEGEADGLAPRSRNPRRMSGSPGRNTAFTD